MTESKKPLDVRAAPAEPPLGVTVCNGTNVCADQACKNVHCLDNHCDTQTCDTKACARPNPCHTDNCSGGHVGPHLTDSRSENAADFERFLALKAEMIALIEAEAARVSRQ